MVPLGGLVVRGCLEAMCCHSSRLANNILRKHTPLWGYPESGRVKSGTAGCDCNTVGDLTRRGIVGVRRGSLLGALLNTRCDLGPELAMA